jgi:hypothetical protein
VNTLWLLMAQYEGQAVIPVDIVARDYFSHLDGGAFARKALAGEIQLPIMSLENSAKSARGVYIKDLATYIDTRAALARAMAAKVARGVPA